MTERRIAMAQIELNRERVEILQEILRSHLSELRMEIANTDTKDFREFLRKRIDFLEQFVYALEKESAGAPREVASKPLAISFAR